MRAVVLLSGGLDSATTLAIGRSWGFECTALTFRYGQRHALEVDAALRVGQALGVVAHQVLSLDPSGLAGSALTGEGAIPRDRSREEIGHAIPATYVPARNTIFLAYALGRAETVGAADVFLGVNAVDYSGYPDCRPEYIEAFERMANLATRAGVEGALRFKVHTPLIALTKKEIIQRGMALGVDYGLTLSCYDLDDSGAACGGCDACVLRLEGFTEAGVRDPARYRAGAGVER